MSPKPNNKTLSSNQFLEEQDSIYNQNDPDDPLPQGFNQNLENTTVYIEGIQGSTIKEIKEMFELNGPIKKIGRLTASKAIIKFHDLQSTNAAISNFNGILHRNKLITVVSCPSQFKEFYDKRFIYIKGITGSKTTQIKKLFSLNGSIKRLVRLTSDSAIIKFNQEQAAHNAIKNLNGFLHNNHRLIVLPAKTTKALKMRKDIMDNEMVIDENRLDDYTIRKDDIIEAEMRKDEIDSELFIDENSINDDNIDNKKGEDDIIEAEIK